MKKTLFIVTYYWPPAGGPGVQRWLKFVTYLPQDLFDIHIVIPENPDYPSIDDTLQANLPNHFRIIKVPIKEPTRWIKRIFGAKTKQLQKGFIEKKPGYLERFLLWIRGNYFIPDARVSWVNQVVKKLKNDSAFAKAETLITTGPPHSVHLIGLWLKQSKFSELEWIADFRDPWTTIGYHKSLNLTKSSAAEHLRLENEVLTKADIIIVTSPSTKTEFEAKTPKPITVITNGFDLNTNTTEQPKGKFTLSHVGTLLADRDPKILWNTLSELVKNNAEFSFDLEIQLAGNVSESVINSIENAGLERHVKQLGYLNHEQAVDIMFTSQALLLIEIDHPDTRAIIPGKLFEYLASRRPIIALGPAKSDIESLLESTNAGTFFTYDGFNLKAHILKLHKAYRNGLLTGNDGDVSDYHRRQLTNELVKLIKD